MMGGARLLRWLEPCPLANSFNESLEAFFVDRPFLRPHKRFHQQFIAFLYASRLHGFVNIATWASSIRAAASTGSSGKRAVMMRSAPSSLPHRMSFSRQRAPRSRQSALTHYLQLENPVVLFIDQPSRIFGTNTKNVDHIGFTDLFHMSSEREPRRSDQSVYSSAQDIYEHGRLDRRGRRASGVSKRLEHSRSAFF